MNRLNRGRSEDAAKHVAKAIVKTLVEMRPHLMKEFQLDGAQINLAIADAAVMIAGSSTAQALALPGERAHDITAKLQGVIIETIDDTPGYDRQEDT